MCHSHLRFVSGPSQRKCLMTQVLSEKMNEWMEDLTNRLSEVNVELSFAECVVKEIRGRKATILRKMNYIHNHGQEIEKINRRDDKIKVDTHSYLPKGKTASDTLDKN